LYVQLTLADFGQ